MITITINEGPGPVESMAFEVLGLEYGFANLVTVHPIENAADVSDHIMRQLDEYVIRVIVTETPLEAIAPRSDGSKSRILEAESFFARAAANTVQLSILGRAPVPRAAIVSWGWRQDNRARAEFDLRVREVRIAKALTVKIPVAAASLTSAPSKQDLGPQTTGELNSSILLSLVGS